MAENKLTKFSTDELIKKNRIAKVLMIIIAAIAIISVIISIITVRRDLSLTIVAMMFIALLMYRGFKKNKEEIERRKNKEG